jgi:ABC-2 type transport system permease protein
MMDEWIITYFKSIGLVIQTQLQYRFSLLMDILSTAMFSVTEMGGLILILGQVGTLSGWSLWELIFLYSIAEASFGWMDMIFSGFDPDYFAPKVRSGDFDKLLLRPYPITLQMMSSRFEVRRLGRILTGTILFFIAASQVSIDWNVWKGFYTFTILLSQVMLFGSLFIFGSTITFWTIERVEMMNIVTYGGREVISYPMDIFPRWMRRFYIFVIPFIFFNYYPGLYLLNKPDPLGLPVISPFLAPFLGVFFLYLALQFWKFGVNHYQSTGT